MLNQQINTRGLRVVHSVELGNHVSLEVQDVIITSYLDGPLQFRAGLLHTLGSLPMVKSETVPVHQGQGEMDERETHPRWVGGGFYRRGNLQKRLSWAAQDGKFLPPPTHQNLKSLQRGLHWCSVTHTVQMVSVMLYFSRLHP